MYSTDNLGLIRAVALDGTTDTTDIKTNYTSRADMIKFKLQQMKEALMDMLDEFIGPYCEAYNIPVKIENNIMEVG